MENQSLLTVKQVLERLNVSRSTLNRIRQRGELQGHKIGGQLRFDPEDIERFLKQTKEGQTDKKG